MTALRGWGLPEQHLALDAIVAFVDGELSPTAYDRAASHLARCAACATEAAAQRQASTAVRAAETPSMSSTLLDALRAIPMDTQLPAQPDELAMTADGQLVTVNSGREKAARAAFGNGPALGSSNPLGSGQQPLGAASSFVGSAQAASTVPEDARPATGQGRSHFFGRRAKQGASVVVSGLVLGVLVFVVPLNDPRQAVPAMPWPSKDNEHGLGGASVTPAANRVATTPTTVPAVAPTTPASAPPPSTRVPVKSTPVYR